MEDNYLSISQWGLPSAKKRALLIHGIASSSSSWYRVAHMLVAGGYLVTAPDLLGHGTAPHSQKGRVQDLAEALRPLFESPYPPFDLIIAHSLGCVVALVALEYLDASRTTAVVLVDPPILPDPPPDRVPDEERTKEGMDIVRAMFLEEVLNTPSIESYMHANPGWAREDAVLKVHGAHMCDPDIIDSIFEQNFPWSFAHLLDGLPSHVKMTILAADPQRRPAFFVEAVEKYRSIRTVVVDGATHSIHREFPDVVAETGLETVAAIEAEAQQAFKGQGTSDGESHEPDVSRPVEVPKVEVTSPTSPTAHADSPPNAQPKITSRSPSGRARGHTLAHVDMAGWRTLGVEVFNPVTQTHVRRPSAASREPHPLFGGGQSDGAGAAGKETLEVLRETIASTYGASLGVLTHERVSEDKASRDGEGEETETEGSGHVTPKISATARSDSPGRFPSQQSNEPGPIPTHELMRQLSVARVGEETVIEVERAQR
ncbi:alpha beta-hydrolase [Coniophora puteana RWD-64-598 SS2]|uniref:Alpha beta-hydrolase n=1 Tax=Coniophora puteana (strain RWD-64-598) TaxID=741705 RepID=A0A5M3MNP9_CONPW|nr:alpha beta-hydrolase [Coniophora puteana RWD-64-598 SS2]EIW80640.1 alpha beta-hydrolase [Coniophora puteana RWD-64-598 SS2]